MPVRVGSSEGLGSAGMCLADLGVGRNGSAKDLNAVAQKLFTSLRLKPMTVELAAMEQIVPCSANEPKDQLGLALMIRRGFDPAQQAIHDCLLPRRTLQVVRNRGLQLSSRRFKYRSDLSRKGAPVGGRIAATRFSKANSLQAVLAAGELLEELERERVQGRIRVLHFEGAEGAYRVACAA